MMVLSTPSYCMSMPCTCCDCAAVVPNDQHDQKCRAPDKRHFGKCLCTGRLPEQKFEILVTPMMVRRLLSTTDLRAAFCLLRCFVVFDAAKRSNHHEGEHSYKLSFNRSIYPSTHPVGMDRINIEKCDKCQRWVENINTCSGCRGARYCSSICQRPIMKDHKAFCRIIRKGA